MSLFIFLFFVWAYVVSYLQEYLWHTISLIMGQLYPRLFRMKLEQNSVRNGTFGTSDFWQSKDLTLENCFRVALPCNLNSSPLSHQTFELKNTCGFSFGPLLKCFLLRFVASIIALSGSEALSFSRQLKLQIILLQARIFKRFRELMKSVSLMVTFVFASIYK